MPKPTDPNLDTLIPLFRSIGLSQSKATEAAKSSKSAATLKSLIEKYRLAERDHDGGLQEKQAGLVAAFAVQIAKSGGLGDGEETYVLDKILEGGLKSVDQVTGTSSLVHCVKLLKGFLEAATKYAECHSVPIDQKDFDEHCGIGTRCCLIFWCYFEQVFQD